MGTGVVVGVVALAGGLAAYLAFRIVFRVRHWWENELERWSDLMRTVRQFFESFLPLVYAAVAAVVLGFGTYVGMNK